jgi:hypothetical protein
MNPHCRIGRIRPKAGGDVRLLPSANIEFFPGTLTRLEIPPERVLLGAITAGISPVAVVGRLPDGELYVATSAAGNNETIALFARAQRIAMEHAGNGHDGPPQPPKPAA